MPENAGENVRQLTCGVQIPKQAKGTQGVGTLLGFRDAYRDQVGLGGG